jgi:hypothetical protein
MRSTFAFVFLLTTLFNSSSQSNHDVPYYALSNFPKTNMRDDVAHT